MGASSADKKRPENMDKLTDRLIAIRRAALSRGATDEQLREALQGSSQTNSFVSRFSLLWWQIVRWTRDPAHRLHVLMLLCAVILAVAVGSYELVNDYIRETPCVVDANIFSDEMLRPVVNCDMCRHLTGAAVEVNLSSETFYNKYAYSGTPVLVKNAVMNWTATSVFSFKYFQHLYKETEGALSEIEDRCQFFPYKTEFLSLEHALNMSDERASFQKDEEPWYIGWSNCAEKVKRQLRQHYQRPYFLPPDSESVDVDWIFMGGAGPGAFIHLDNVERPSWQAQISGRKTWELLPSPECESVCPGFNVTVEKGDIIVVDTNIWYHSTFIHPGEISITIGSEYD